MEALTPFPLLHIPATFLGLIFEREVNEKVGLVGILEARFQVRHSLSKKCLGKQFLTTPRTSLMLNVPLILILR